MNQSVLSFYLSFSMSSAACSHQNLNVKHVATLFEEVQTRYVNKLTSIDEKHIGPDERHKVKSLVLDRGTMHSVRPDEETIVCERREESWCWDPNCHSLATDTDMRVCWYTRWTEEYLGFPLEDPALYHFFQMIGCDHGSIRHPIPSERHERALSDCYCLTPL